MNGSVLGRQKALKAGITTEIPNTPPPQVDVCRSESGLSPGLPAPGQRQRAAALAEPAATAKLRHGKEPRHITNAVDDPQQGGVG